jgi:hypothetical protein
MSRVNRVCDNATNESVEVKRLRSLGYDTNEISEILDRRDILTKSYYTMESKTINFELTVTREHGYG